jgi:hypothetical protein
LPPNRNVPDISSSGEAWSVHSAHTQEKTVQNPVKKKLLGKFRIILNCILDWMGGCGLCSSSLDYGSVIRQRITSFHIVAYLLRATTVKPENQPLLNNGCITRNNAVTLGSGVSCDVFAETV